MIDPRTPTGTLVVERPSRSKVFEAFGLDYCCHGDQPLTDACGHHGIAVDDVVKAIVDHDAEHGDEAEAEWTSLGIGALATHIDEVHHTYLRRELPRVVELASEVASAHGDRHPETRELEQVVDGMAAELDLHLMKEERVLFPMCRYLELVDTLDSDYQGTISGPVSCMRFEHDDAAEQLTAIRRLTNDFTAPGDACPTWHAYLDALRDLEADLHAHIHKENVVLFPRALEREAALRN